MSRFKIIKKEPVLKDGFNHFCGRLRHGRSELASEPARGRTRKHIKRKSAEAIARLIKKKEKALTKFGVLFGCCL